MNNKPVSNTDSLEAQKAQNNCICVHVKCERHGKCEECITHHKEKKKYVPYCMRKNRKNKERI